MISLPRFLALLAVPLTAAVLATACTANVEEGCVGGQCVPPGSTPTTSSSTTGSTGAGGGEGGGGGAGGGDAGTCADPPTTGDFPCDVADVLKAKCQKCHQNPPMNGAPFPLLAFEDVLPIYTGEPRWKRMQKAVTSGFMPLNDTLDDAQKKTLLDWLDACATPADEGKGCDAP